MVKIKRQPFLLSVLLLTLLCCASQADELVPPEPVSIESSVEFLEAHPDADIAYLQEYSGFDIEYDEAREGLSGKLIVVREWCPLDSDGLEEASSIIYSESPSRRLKSMEIRVVSGSKEHEYKKKDLRWQEFTSRNNGVVYLDGSIAVSMIPGLNLGDRIWVKYEYVVKGWHGLGAFPLGQSSYPVSSSTLDVRLPEEYQIAWGATAQEFVSNDLSHEIIPDGKRTIHRWQTIALPDGSVDVCDGSFGAHKLVIHFESAGQDVLSNMTVAPDWGSLGDGYLERIEDVFDSNEILAAKALSLIEGVDDPVQQIDRIYTFVQQNYRYLGLFEGRGGLIPVSAVDVFDNGFGDCKGLATLLISMLRVCGIEAHPVLVLSSRSQHLNTDVPSLAQFNHFIAWADDGADGIFLDGTVNHCPAGLVPAGDMFSPVLLLKTGAVCLVEIPRAVIASNETTLSAIGHLDEQGFLKLDMECKLSDSRALRWRGHLTGLNEFDRNKSIKEVMLPESHLMSSSEVSVLGLAELRQQLVLQTSAISKSPVTRSGNELFLPRTFWQMSPLVREDYKCEGPVDVRNEYPVSEIWNIELPSGFSLVQPDTLKLSGGGLEWSCCTWQESNILKMERRFYYTVEYAGHEQIVEQNKLVKKIHQFDRGYWQLRCQ